MELDLTGRVAVVTGASKGIGLAITTLLAEEGVHVFAGAREASDELAALGETGRVEHVEVDLATQEGATALVDAATSSGRLDILVNNVGAVTPRLAGFLAVTDEQWMHSLNLNLMAAVRTTRAALPTMLAAEAGRHRDHQLGERVPARPRCHRLQRRQGGAEQLLQVACPRRSDRTASASTP